MKFGPVPVGEAEGGILAHAIDVGGRRLKKGHVLDRADLSALLSERHRHVVVARLDDGDVAENEAARRIGVALVKANANLRADDAFTGRVNIYAETNGCFLSHKESVDTLNRVDPAITLATLGDGVMVDAGRMVATVKIIPFAVSERSIMAAEIACSRTSIKVASPVVRRVGLVATRLPSLKDSVMDKTRRVLAERLTAQGAVLTSEMRVEHTELVVASALLDASRDCELIIVFGASAIVDVNDIIPAAIRAAGGQVHRFGMPVDPGNLLLTGTVAGTPVIGAPGCARSPARKRVRLGVAAGRTWCADRVHRPVRHGCGRPFDGDHRPSPAARPTCVTTGIILAGGLSRRMGARNKLLEVWNGKPLMRHVVDAALASELDDVLVVLGHEADTVQAVLPGGVHTVLAPGFMDGLSATLRAGMAASEGPVMVLLGDMPLVSASHINALLAAFNGENPLVAASHEGRLGNPVLFGTPYRNKLLTLTGDKGARSLLETEPVSRVEIGPAALRDFDTPDAFE